MRDTIEQFMWGFQPHFRHGIEYDVEKALEAIGANLRPLVLLVGVRTDPTKRFPICVEPETGGLQPDHFAGLDERTAELFDTDPETQITHSYRRLHDLRQDALRQRARATAITEMIEASRIHPGKTFFVSYSAPIGGYAVHTCIGVDTDAIGSLPALTGDSYERIRASRSLAIGVVEHVAELADQALYLPDPGSSLRASNRTTAEIVRHAAIWFAEGCVIRTDELTGADLYDNLLEMAQQHYEGAHAHGSVVLSRRDHPHVRPAVIFEQPVSIREHRAVRKLLETTSSHLSLLIDGPRAYGLGTVVDGYDASAQDLFTIEVTGHATWELLHDGRGHMRVSYGAATLPKPLVDRVAFDETFERIFGPGIRDDNAWNAIDAATRAQHGAMIVISSAADLEGQRLSGQATLITPKVLEPSAVENLCGIDGAMLIEPDGRCHAVAVILDGVAATEGDPARGARYNSAVRYLGTTEHKTLICIVSEDGSIDVLPRPHPRIHHSQVAFAMEELRRFSGNDPDGEFFYNAWKEVERLAFYMNQAECDEANALHAAEQEARLAAGGIAVHGPLLRPNPAMDDSFFLSD